MSTLEIEDSIQRCEHDEENPYLQISRDFIRDNTLSTNLRWFITFCLSFDKSWKISIPVFMKQQKISKDKMYRIIDQGIEKGYIKREDYIIKGLKKPKYFISEHPKFKKSLPCPEKQDPEKQDPEKQDTKKEQDNTSFQSVLLKKEQKKEKSDVPSADASELASLLLLAIRKTKNDYRQPNLEKWAIEIDRMMNIDKISKERILRILDWLPTHDIWKINILSADKLRKKFDQLELHLESNKEEANVKINKKLVLEAKEQHPEALKRIYIKNDFVMDSNTSKELHLKMHPQAFKSAFYHLIGARDE